ncbi:MAG: 3-keto-disaccharide hydrolase [Opitutales bacterium]
MKTYLIFSFLIFASFKVTDAGRFFGDPPSGQYAWAVHDSNRPLPPIVEPGKNYGDPPSDAIVLFDGTQESFANWKHDRPDDKRKKDWKFTEDYMQAVRGSGYIHTKEEFGDIQLHIEWAAPEEAQGNGQGRGNSGVFFMDGMVEVQVLDNYRNPTYADGSAGAVYGVMPPAANPLRPPGEWQSYDIIFRRPIVREDKVLDPGSLTVLLNGVVVQDNTALDGGGGYKKRQPLNRVFPEKGKIKLQDHGNPVRFRNIWVRPLRPRALEGGTDGRLSMEAALAKRAEIAESIRADAMDMQGIDKGLRLYESIVYSEDSQTRSDAEALIQAYIKKFSNAPKPDKQSYKGKMLELDRALQYLNKFNYISDDHQAMLKVDRICKEQGWKKR